MQTIAHHRVVRRSVQALAAACVPLLAAQLAHAASPSLGAINPRGGQRGTQTSIFFDGGRLGDTQEVLFHKRHPDDAIPFKVLELKVHNDSRVEAVVRIADDCPLGEYAMRVRTATGVSPMRTFWVGQFPAVAEKEPNDAFDEPQPIDMNVTVTGVVTNEDVDYFLVDARKGQRISAEVEGIRLGLTLFDPYVAILDMARFERSASDDTALLLQDSIASIVAPEDGTYVVQIRESAYGGNGSCRYRLHVGSFPRPLAAYPAGGPAGEQVRVTFIGDAAGAMTRTFDLPVEPRDHYAANSRHIELFAEHDGLLAASPNRFRVSSFANVLESEPNNDTQTATATDLTLPLAFNGIIAEPGDVDWFRFKAAKGAQYDVRVHARSLGSPLDSVLSIYDAAGKRLADNDDAGGLDSSMRYRFPDEGAFFIAVRDHLNDGGDHFVYRVEVAPVRRGLTAQIPRFGRDSQARKTISVPRGNRTATLMNSNRHDVDGDLVFVAPDLPAGVTMHAQTLPSNLSQHPIVFEAAPDAPIAGTLVNYGVRHADESQNVFGHYSQVVDLVLGPPNNTVYYWCHVSGLPMAVTEAVPFSIELVEPKVPLVQNGLMNLQILAERRDGFDGPITVRMLWNPPGVGSKTTVTIDKGKNQVLYPINASGAAQTRTWHIAALGEADAGSGQVLISSHLAKLTVEPPFVTMKMHMTALEQGESGQVLCTLSHNKPFEGPADAELLGLPPNVKTAPRQITRDDKELLFDLETTTDSPPGTHKQLFCRVTVLQDDVPIVHNVGQGGVLRIDRPPPPPKNAPPKPKAEPKPKPPQPKKNKPLTRLEKLRIQAKERAEAAAAE